MMLWLYGFDINMFKQLISMEIQCVYVHVMTSRIWMVIANSSLHNMEGHHVKKLVEEYGWVITINHI